MVFKYPILLGLALLSFAQIEAQQYLRRRKLGRSNSGEEKAEKPWSKSGLLTVGDIAEMLNSMCYKLQDVKKLLKSPLLKLVGSVEALLEMKLPIPSRRLLDPTGIFRFFLNYLGKLLEWLTRILNKKQVIEPPKIDPASEEEQKSKSWLLTPKDLVRVAEKLCKPLRFVASFILNRFTGFFLRGIKLPIFDSENPKLSWRALDVLGLADIPKQLFALGK